MKIIFLDIDGVIQPIQSRNRFKHDLRKLQEELTQMDSRYQNLHFYDIGAVYYDWDKEVIGMLKLICAYTECKFVITSSWRYYNPYDKLLLLFKIHKLDEFVIATTKDTGVVGYSRPEGIQEYLSEHPEVEQFVVLDDVNYRNYEKLFPNNLVITKVVMTHKDAAKILEILEGKNK